MDFSKEYNKYIKLLLIALSKKWQVEDQLYTLLIIIGQIYATLVVAFCEFLLLFFRFIFNGQL